MQILDYLLIAAIVVAAVFAVRHMWKKHGACCGDCASCRNCTQLKKREQ